MSLVDEKGRIFGRINLIDLMLLLGVVVIAALAFVVLTKQGKVVTVPENKTIIYTVVVRAIRPDVAENIKVGDLVKKQTTQGDIGVIKSVRIEPAKMVVDTADGRKVLAASPFEKDAYITIETKGRAGKDIIATGAEVLRAGDKFFIVTKWFTGEAVITDIHVEGDQS